MINNVTESRLKRFIKFETFRNVKRKDVKDVSDSNQLQSTVQPISEIMMMLSLIRNDIMNFVEN